MSAERCQRTGKLVEAGAPRTSTYKKKEDKDWQHFVCEVCGNVEKLPWSPDDKKTSYFPMCAHGNNYSWPFDRDVEAMEEFGWVKMKLATVLVDVDEEATQELHYPNHWNAPDSPDAPST